MLSYSLRKDEDITFLPVKFVCKHALKSTWLRTPAAYLNLSVPFRFAHIIWWHWSCRLFKLGKLFVCSADVQTMYSYGFAHTTRFFFFKSQQTTMCIFGDTFGKRFLRITIGLWYWITCEMNMSTETKLLFGFVAKISISNSLSIVNYENQVPGKLGHNRLCDFKAEQLFLKLTLYI